MSRCFENSSPQSCCCSALLGGLFSPSPGKKARTRSLVVDTFWGGAARAGRAEAEAERQSCLCAALAASAFGLASPPRGGRQLLEKRLAWIIREEAGAGMSVEVVGRPNRLSVIDLDHCDWTRRCRDVNPDSDRHPSPAVRADQKMRYALASDARAGQKYACGLGSVVEASSVRQKVVVMLNANVDVGCFSVRG